MQGSKIIENNSWPQISVDLFKAIKLRLSFSTLDVIVCSSGLTFII